MVVAGVPGRCPCPPSLYTDLSEPVDAARSLCRERAGRAVCQRARRVMAVPSPSPPAPAMQRNVRSPGGPTQHTDALCAVGEREEGRRKERETEWQELMRSLIRVRLRRRPRGRYMGRRVETGSAGARPLAVAWFLFEGRPPSSSASRLALFCPPNPKPSQGYRLEYVLFLHSALAPNELTLSLALADLATLAGFSSSAQPLPSKLPLPSKPLFLL